MQIDNSGCYILLWWHVSEETEAVGTGQPGESLFTVTFPCSPTLILRLYINVNNPMVPDNKRSTIMLILVYTP
jgi:hypothetical protein